MDKTQPPIHTPTPPKNGASGSQDQRTPEPTPDTQTSRLHTQQHTYSDPDFDTSAWLTAPETAYAGGVPSGMRTVVNADPLTQLITNTKRPVVSDWIRIGFLVSAGFFLILALWSIFAPLSTGANIVGRVSVAGERDVIEHLEGGIVKAVHVAAGDAVRRGDLLVEMDPAATRARLTDVITRLYALEARRARLEAEWDFAPAPNFAAIRSENVPVQAQQIITDLERSQFSERQNIFEAQRRTAINAVQAQKDVLSKERDMLVNIREQLNLIGEEITGVEDLLEKGFASKTRALSLKRQREGLLSRELELESSVLSQQSRVEAAELDLRNLVTERKQQVAELLSQTHVDLESERARLQLVEDQMQRSRIVASTDGIVMDLKVHTVGEVVEPGGAILDLVPQDARLIVSGRLASDDVASIHPGLPVRMRIAAFKGRNAPVVEGEVLVVSPDILVDERTGEAYYEVSIGFTNEGLAALGPDQTLQPGLPVQAVIETAAQPVITYLISPILQTVRQGFVEP